jgi:hypothetical protein
MISPDIRNEGASAMPTALPALNLIAEPGRRRATLDTAREIERRGFAGISVSSSFGNMSQSVGLALATERISFATAITPIYAQSVDEFAQNAAYLHEVSGGRFQFGIGIAHAPAYVRMEVLCHEHHRSKRRCGTVREMKEGPSGSAIRSLIPSHRKLLWSKVTVVSVAETPGR